MTPESAIVTARQYASDWGTQLLEVRCVTEVHPWWRLFQLTVVHLEFTSESGRGTICVHHRRGVEEFYLELDDLSGHMHPMWAAFPDLYMVSMVWRYGDMFPPERYKHAWHHWYRRLTAEKQLDYQKRFPAPTDWEGFYSDVASVPAIPGDFGDYFVNRVP